MALRALNDAHVHVQLMRTRLTFNFRYHLKYSGLIKSNITHLRVCDYRFYRGRGNCEILCHYNT